MLGPDINKAAHTRVWAVVVCTELLGALQRGPTPIHAGLSKMKRNKKDREKGKPANDKQTRRAGLQLLGMGGVGVHGLLLGQKVLAHLR